jgi:hypothetical protein
VDGEPEVPGVPPVGFDTFPLEPPLGNAEPPLAPPVPGELPEVSLSLLHAANNSVQKNV